VKPSYVHFPSLKKLEIGADIMDVNEIVYFLSGSPNLETLQVYFYFVPEEFVTKVVIPTLSSSKTVNDNFTWSYFNINEGSINMGIVGNFHSMAEAFLDVFSPVKSEFVDPILKLIRNDNSELHCKGLKYEEGDIYLLSHHSTSQVNFIFIVILICFLCVVWY